MRTIRAKSGGISERPFFKPGEIDRTCSEELKRLGLYPEQPGPVRVDRFLEKRFGISHNYAELPDGILGYTVFGRKGVEEIVVAAALDNEDHEPTRRRLRSTLAHEGGHGLLHAHIFALEPSSSLFGDRNSEGPKILCREVSGVSSETRGKAVWSEYQANQAIGGLLLPRHLVMTALAPLLSTAGLLRQCVLTVERQEEAEQLLARIFDVNPIVARIRLADMFAADNAGQGLL